MFAANCSQETVGSH